MPKAASPDFDRFMRRLWISIGAFLALVGIPLMVYAIYLERRFHDFEDSLRYRGPAAGQPVVVDGDLESMVMNPVQGQVVYVPVYSHVYHQNGEPHLLTITLSIRNTSPDHPLAVTSVRYFDTNGREVRNHVQKPLQLGPLATTEFLVERDDVTGGSGANFLVEWVAGQPVSEPVVEAVMIDTTTQQGISFARAGVAIKDLRPSSATTAPTPDP